MPRSTRTKEVELEQLTGRLFSMFPGADTVKHDVRVRGKSGILRQIDVLITKKIGPVEITIVVDTKRKGKRVRRTDVLTVYDIKEDIGAAVAFVVAPNGFDRGAKEFAKTHDIRLLKSVNTEERGWTGKLLLPVTLDIRALVYWTDQAVGKDVLGILAQELTKWWDDGGLPVDVHTYSYSFSLGLMRQGILEKDVTVSVQESRYSKSGKLPLRFFGLFNESGREFATDLMEADCLLSAVLENWPSTESAWGERPCIPLYSRMVLPGQVENGIINVIARDLLFKFELLPADALIDLKPSDVKVPFKLTWSYC